MNIFEYCEYVNEALMSSITVTCVHSEHSTFSGNLLMYYALPILMRFYLPVVMELLIIIHHRLS